MSIRYSYNNFSTKGHGVIETRYSQPSNDEYVLYEIEKDIPQNYKCIAKTKDLSAYIKDPDYSLRHGKKGRITTTRAKLVKRELHNGHTVRVDQTIIKFNNGIYEVYRARRNSTKSKPISQQAKKDGKKLIGKRQRRVQTTDEIYRHLLAIQRNARKQLD